VRQGFHFAVILFVAVRNSSAQLPDGKGREAVKKLCTECHEIGSVIGSRRTRIGWRQNVEDMVARGAEGSAEEVESVVEYMTAFFGKVNVNTASTKDLQSALGFSEREAQAIVDYRERNGDFKDFEQLKKVPGLNPQQLQSKRPQIAFSL
jgi:competence ComEA-like helix-hairpin-helix protein